MLFSRTGEGTMSDNHPYKKIFLLQREGFASYSLYYTRESAEEAGRELEKRPDLYPHNRYAIYEYTCGLKIASGSNTRS
jgi:hypothetical protein